MNDIIIVFRWWSVLFVTGAAAFPITKKLFSSWPASNASHSDAGWYDRGYIFSKAVGMALITYLVFVLGMTPFFSFSVPLILVASGIVFAAGLFLHRTGKKKQIIHEHVAYNARSFSITLPTRLIKKIIIVALEEVFFLLALFFWAWIKAHEPSIRGLEKFMDYGFMQSIINTVHFPPADMWYAGGVINYYYFGHLVTALLTKLSDLPLSLTFNLMLDTIFALCLTMSFSIGVQLLRIGPIRRIGRIGQVIGGLLTGFLVTSAGNMQTIYAFTRGYSGDDVVPFWTILWDISEITKQLGEGMTRYWYANATRFIPFSIHEFPSYSFVVSDVHGHVLSIPFVLLAIALLITIFGGSGNRMDETNGTNMTHRTNTQTMSFFSCLTSHVSLSMCFYGFLLGILLMTNALDGPIYFLLFASMYVVFQLGKKNRWTRGWWGTTIGVLIGIGWIVFVTALPFLIHFDSFATGIGVNCPPQILENTKYGPFIFETVDKCQKSPLWMMWLLWGFFWFTGAWLFVRKMWEKEDWNSPLHRVLIVFFLFSIFLIIFPEFFYVKDIYPAHFRSNTMFKLGYQAFIMWSIIAGHVIATFIFGQRVKTKEQKEKIKNTYHTYRGVFIVLLLPQLFLVSIFPIFAVRSYFNELRTYKSIDGVGWLQNEYPDDWNAIEWMKEQKKGSSTRAINTGLPVLIEADGDSYTDYNHFSAFTGFPSVVGWAVHEWLWRGTYDVVSPRREEVRKIYEGDAVDEKTAILTKYGVIYIIVGTLEREKFTRLNEAMLEEVASPVFVSGGTVVYQVNY